MAHTIITYRLRLSSIMSGLALWGAFCVVAVGLRGVRWDENFEFAQVLLGQAPYPPDHPLAQYVHQFYSLQTWSLAALMALFPGPLLANALRNVLFLLATVWPPFLLGALLSGRARWGHAAALLVLMGIHVPFYSNYPVQIWPGLYSNGQVGLGWALLTVTLLLFGYMRTGSLLLGLMPAVHLGQFPPVLAWTVLRGLWLWRTGQREALRQAAPWWFGGTMVSGGFWFIVRAFTLPIPMSGPYSCAVEPDIVLRGYLAHFAAHRAIPWDTGQIVVVAALLLTVAAARWKEGAGGTWWWLGVYAGIVAMLVWGIMAVHARMGLNTPRLLIAWMPYRLINHLSPILIAMMAALLGEKMPGRPWVAGALLYGAVRPLLGAILPASLFVRYFEMGDAIFFAMLGATAVMLAWGLRQDKWFCIPWMALASASLIALDLVHQFGAACCVLGGLAAVASILWHFPAHPRWMPFTTACAIALICLLLLQQASQREHLPVSPFEHQVRQYLLEKNEPNAMILVRHQQESLQARLGHPVMTDMATTTWIPYQPSLGPALYKMYRDFYGITLTAPPHQPAASQPWFEVWPAKTRAEWQNLAKEYQFHYILAPAFMNLDLPKILQGSSENLFLIEQ
ncbi:MAG TPA: hypothetical protein PLI09_08135 [Candidatus Hydrogenedentes bacterium]|nr:hypothetical protein [Candidatus Hydrogenedentota bacterium]